MVLKKISSFIDQLKKPLPPELGKMKYTAWRREVTMYKLYPQGCLHREDGPALIEHYFKDNQVCRSWYNKGKLLRKEWGDASQIRNYAKRGLDEEGKPLSTAFTCKDGTKVWPRRPLTA